MLMPLVLWMVCALWGVRALQLINDSHPLDVPTLHNPPTLQNGTDAARKCLVWQSDWKPTGGKKQIFFFDLGVETGQSALVALGESPRSACRYNTEYAQSALPKEKRLHECMQQAQKTRKILRIANDEAAKHQMNLFNDGKVVMVEPSPAYSPAIKKITEAYPHRTQSFAKAITGFNESQIHLQFSVTDKSCDPDVISTAVLKGLPVVDVGGLNLMQLLTRTVRPEDFVIVKMDVEGAEFDILPCLVASSSIKLIDMFFIERHDWMPVGKKEGNRHKLDAALKTMQDKHIIVREDWP